MGATQSREVKNTRAEKNWSESVLPRSRKKGGRKKKEMLFKWTLRNPCKFDWNSITSRKSVQLSKEIWVSCDGMNVDDQQAKIFSLWLGQLLKDPVSYKLSYLGVPTPPLTWSSPREASFTRSHCPRRFFLVAIECFLGRVNGHRVFLATRLYDEFSSSKRQHVSFSTRISWRGKIGKLWPFTRRVFRAEQKSDRVNAA